MARFERLLLIITALVAVAFLHHQLGLDQDQVPVAQVAAHVGAMLNGK
jgi:hypothetical protein